jgi:two-component system, OmpR family, phosphate regulon response regulator PhoB
MKAHSTLSPERHVDVAHSVADELTFPSRPQNAMEDKPLILVVDDEIELARTVSYSLELEGFSTRHAETGRAAIELALGQTPDLILLDLMLPDVSGMEVCRALRRSDATRSVPIIFLTAKDNEIDRVVAFELGADDYVAKPFSVRELMLRVRALLRRAKATRSTPPSVGEQQFERLRVDAEAYQVWVDGVEVSLTALEFRLLHTLLGRRGRVQTRSQLLEDVWGVHADVTTRTVDTHVKRLREKLGDAGAYIETIRGVGYRFRGSSAASV